MVGNFQHRGFKNKIKKPEFEVVNNIVVSINTIVACLYGSKSDTSNIS